MCTGEPHRRQLPAERDLTLDKALALTQTLEMVEENTHTLQGEVSARHQLNSLVSRQEVSGATGTTFTQDVHKVITSTQGKNCYRCGKGITQDSWCADLEMHNAMRVARQATSSQYVGVSRRYC